MSLDIARPRTIGAPIVVATARYVLLPLANLLTGYSVKAMERKIERGDWQEGKVWRRAPDGRIVIDVLGYQRWVDIHAIKQAMQMRPVRALTAMPTAIPDTCAAISVANFAKNRVAQIVIRPPESPEFGSSLAVGNAERSKPLNREEIKWRRGWDSNPRRRR